MTEHLTRFEQFLRIRNRSEDTIKRYLSTASEFIAVVGEKDYDMEDVEDFLLYLQRKHKTRGFKNNPKISGTYQRYTYYCLKTFYRALGIKWTLEKEAVPKLDAPHRPFYKMDELEKILAVARRERLRDWVAFRVLALAFTRRKGLAELRMPDYDQEQGTIKMPSIKKGRRKVIQLDPETRKQLNVYLASRKDHLPALFASEKPQDDVGAMSLPLFNYLLSKYSKMAGVENKGVHAWRRGMITYLWEQGMKELEIAAAGDWKDVASGVKMVAEYVQLSPKYAAEKVTQLHPFYSEKKTRSR